MIRIAITPEAPVAHEAAMIATIIDSGWDYVHLRHPALAEQQLAEIASQIPEAIRSRVTLHDHFDLALEYHLGGIHLNRRNPQAPAGFEGRISRSCHSVDEAISATGCDYITLSPIFDSLSKHGYTSTFTAEQIREAINRSATPIVALGGVTPDKLQLIHDLGFGGYAVLGALNWQNTYELIESLNKFRL